MLLKSLVRQKKIENSNETYFLSFQGRPPHKDKVIVDVVRTLIENFWCDNTRASPNQKDVVKRRIGKTNHEPHTIFFLDMIQTQFYEMFLHIFPRIKINQRFFEMTKPFYVKINHTHTTCCCRVLCIMNFITIYVFVLCILTKYCKNVIYNYILSHWENLLQVYYVNEMMGEFIIKPCVWNIFSLNVVVYKSCIDAYI